MKRSKPLKADPERTRAWQQRSREKAAENARWRAEGQRSSLQRKPVSTPAAPAKAPVTFTAKRPARTQWCARCRRRRASSWHHWLPQAQIKVYVRGLRLPEAESRRLLRRLLADERNLSPFCDADHGSHGTTAHAFYADEVPASAHAFAAELGPEWATRLERLYPPRPDAPGRGVPGRLPYMPRQEATGG